MPDVIVILGWWIVFAFWISLSIFSYIAQTSFPFPNIFTFAFNFFVLLHQLLLQFFLIFIRLSTAQVYENCLFYFLRFILHSMPINNHMPLWIRMVQVRQQRKRVRIKHKRQKTMREEHQDHRTLMTLTMQLTLQWMTNIRKSMCISWHIANFY